VNKYLLDDYRVFNTGDDSDVITAFAAGFYVYVENALQSLCPGYGGPFFGRGLVGLIN
jgi:hypothetical protein